MADAVEAAGGIVAVEDDAAYKSAASVGANFGYLSCEPCTNFKGWWGAKTVIQRERVAYYVLLTGAMFIAFAYVFF